MKTKNLFAWIDNVNDWLDGMTFEEKVKTLESGKLVQCLKCKRIFFDRETPEDRHRRKCISARNVHDCVERENYTVLKRNFLGICWVVNYPDNVSLKDAIIKFFQSKKIRRML
ncbi:MAG: hypothetical protein KKD05_05135 [Candidatus Omnitrophica bacterium]|nr:hypothetical protein [Candidatus Omnitrophota bacterium]